MHCAIQGGQEVPEPPGSSATILVIEDERFVRKATCDTLRAAGYRVHSAECAAAATKLFWAYRNQIQLLLCDAVLPDSSGARLARTLRRRSSAIKVILVSGYPEAARWGYFDQKSGNEFLAKPYSAAVLVAKVQTVLQKAGLRKETVA